MATTIKIDDTLEQYLKDTQKKLYEEQGIQLKLAPTLHHVFYTYILKKPNQTKSLKKFETESKSLKPKKTKSLVDAKNTVLAPKEKEAMELKEQGFSYEEIASKMTCQESTVRGYLTKARKKMPE